MLVPRDTPGVSVRPLKSVDLTRRFGVVEFHDVRDPWTVRFGLGREGESGSATPRSTVVGLGFGWRFDKLVLDFGVVRRSLAGGDAPTSFDDRVVVTATQEF